MRIFSSFKTAKESESDSAEFVHAVSPSTGHHSNTFVKMIAERSGHDVYTVKEDSLDIQDSDEKMLERSLVSPSLVFSSKTSNPTPHNLGFSFKREQIRSSLSTSKFRSPF